MSIKNILNEMIENKLNEGVAKIACLKCDEVSTAAAWKKKGGFCPKCKVSNQGVAESVELEEGPRFKTAYGYAGGSKEPTAREKEAQRKRAEKRRQRLAKLYPNSNAFKDVKKEDLDEAVEVRHDRYLRSHGKKASAGTGHWMFTHKNMGDVDYNNEKEVHTAAGKFSDAKKSAQQWAKKHGHREVYVMESVELDEAVKVNKKQYSWGKMITVEVGSSNTFPLHPEEQKKIAGLKDGQKVSFKDETGSLVTASRNGDRVHLNKSGSNQKVAVALSHFTESVQLSELKLGDSEKAFDLTKKAEGYKRAMIKNEKSKEPNSHEKFLKAKTSFVNTLKKLKALDVHHQEIKNLLKGTFVRESEIGGLRESVTNNLVEGQYEEMLKDVKTLSGPEFTRKHQMSKAQFRAADPNKKDPKSRLHGNYLSSMKR